MISWKVNKNTIQMDKHLMLLWPKYKQNTPTRRGRDDFANYDGFNNRFWNGIYILIFNIIFTILLRYVMLWGRIRLMVKMEFWVHNMVNYINLKTRLSSLDLPFSLVCVHTRVIFSHPLQYPVPLAVTSVAVSVMFLYQHYIWQVVWIHLLTLRFYFALFNRRFFKLSNDTKLIKIDTFESTTFTKCEFPFIFFIFYTVLFISQNKPGRKDVPFVVLGHICDMIKRNESDVGDVVLALSNPSYVTRYPMVMGFASKWSIFMFLKKRWCKKIEIEFFNKWLISLDRVTYWK